MKAESAIKLAPSILSADFARLGEQVAEATQAGADYIHVDVMDGCFVPKITWGPGIVAALKSWTHLPLDVHLMIVEPERHIQSFLDAGADILTVHVEACTHLHRIISQIKDHGARAGLAINPGTSVLEIEGAWHWLDLVLVMTVDPGLSGQKYIEGSEKKVARIRNIMERREVKAELEVDGGINAQTAPLVLKAGAQVLVAGSAIYNNDTTVAEAIARIKESISQA